MTIQQFEQKYQGLQIVPCDVTSEAGKSGMYLFLFPSVKYTPVEVKNILDNAVRDFVGNNSYHEYVSSSKDDCYVRVIFADINVLIPAKMVE